MNHVFSVTCRPLGRFGASKLFCNSLVPTYSARPALRFCPQHKLQYGRALFATKPRPSRKAALPEDYDPDEGVKFWGRDLTEREVKRTFGPNVSTDFANHVLRVLHGRRLAGTLNDAWTAHPTKYHERVEENALSWLRKNCPVDETAAYRERVEKEQSQHEEEVLADAERLGIWHPQQNVPEGNVWGRGYLDEVQEKSQKRERRLDLAQRRKRVEEERLAQQAETNAVENPASQTIDKPRVSQWVEYYRKRGQISDFQSPPDMPFRRRVSPSLAVALATAMGSMALASSYTSPSQSERLWPNTPPVAATVLSIIVANTAVFLAWRIPPLWRALNKYFICCPGYPYAMSIVGSVFSHQSLQHFAVNMAGIWVIGTRFHDSVNRGDFMAIYLTAGVVGCSTSLILHTLRGNLATSTLGASGCLCGLISAWLWMKADHSFSPIFLPSKGDDSWLDADSYAIPAYTLLGFLVMTDVFGIFSRWGKVDHAAHLGGYAGGIATLEGLKALKQKTNGGDGSRGRRFIDEVMGIKRGKRN